MVTPAGVAGLRFADEADTANAQAAQLRAQGADIIVLALHEGGATTAGATGITEPSCAGLSGDIVPILERLDTAIDVVISGHTHQAYVCDYSRVNPAKPFLLTSAGQYGTLVTDIALRFDTRTRRLDGKSALSDGRSQWITGPAARADVQRLRARSCAVLTGAGTVMADNPRLTVRDFAVERQPLRVVAEGVMCAGALERAVYQDGGRTVVACALAHPGQRAKLQAQGVTVWELPLANNPGKVDLPVLLAQLAQEYGVNELLVEAGMGVCGALLQADLVDELVIYQAPVTLGHDARGLFDIPPLPNLDVARRWQWHDVAKVGNDLRLTLRR